MIKKPEELMNSQFEVKNIDRLVAFVKIPCCK